MPVLKAIIDTLLPALCRCCGNVLVSGERHICLECFAKIEASGCNSAPNNIAERQLMGRIDFAAATSLYLYQKGTPVQKAVHAMKYHGDTGLCLLLGRQLGHELARSGRFDSVDVLLPVPLHWARRLHRGYNQSALLCQGIAEVWPRPIDTTTLRRLRYTRRQSRASGAVRRTNVQGAFGVKNGAALKGKHVLLVDDVLTTGSTLAACAEALRSLGDIRLSIATLCIVQ